MAKPHFQITSALKIAFVAGVLFMSASSSAATPHMFNAHLLEPNQLQISIAGNFKMGLNEDLQIGGSGLFALAGVINGSLKHRMFESPIGITSLNMHLGIFDAEDRTGLAGFYGINHTVTWSENIDVSGNLYNFSLKASEKFLAPNLSDYNLWSFSAAVDYYRGSKTFTFIAFLPLYSDVYESDDLFEARLNQIELFSSSALVPPALFASATLTSGVFHFEPGIILSEGFSSLFLNLYWKW